MPDGSFFTTSEHKHAGNNPLKEAATKLRMEKASLRAGFFRFYDYLSATCFRTYPKNIMKIAARGWEMKITVGGGPLTKVEFSVGGNYGWLDVSYSPDNAEEELFNFFVFSIADEEGPYSERAFSLAAPYMSHAGKLLREQIKLKLEEALIEIVCEVEEQTIREIEGLTVEQAKERYRQIRELVENRKLVEVAKRKRTNVRGPGRPEGWPKETLRQHVMAIAASISKHRVPRLADVAMALNLSSGDALRKLLNRRGLDWKELKSGRNSRPI